MEAIKNKYSDHLFSRYFILKEGLFKNTKKLLSIYKDCLIVENIDESESETIKFEEILKIEHSHGNTKDFTISFKNSKGLDQAHTFSSNLRSQVICDLLKQIDYSSKINKYPVETYKCHLFFEYYESNLEMMNAEMGKSQSDVSSVKSKPPLSGVEVTLNLYRSFLELVPQDTKREIRIRFSDIELVKVYDNFMIKFELFNKIDLYVSSKNPKKLKEILEKLNENSKIFLGIETNIDYISLKEISMMNKIYTLPKTKIFSFPNVKRILYNNQNVSITFFADYDFIYEIYENSEGIIYRINKFFISEISYLILYESSKYYFEVILRNNSRFLYQTSDNERDIIITNILDLLGNKEDSNFLLLTEKPNFSLKVNGFVNDKVDWEYEKLLLFYLYTFFKDESLRENLIEDICINFCFKSEKFKNEQITNKKVYQVIYELATEQFNSLDNLIKAEEKESQLKETSIIQKNISTDSLMRESKVKKVFRKVYNLNNYLIMCKNLFLKSHYDKMISDILIFTENSPAFSSPSNFNFQTIFYNIFMIFKNLIPPKTSLLKKDEIAQRKWMISSHFDNAFKIKKILFGKIFTLPQSEEIQCINKPIENFEKINCLVIYSLMCLQKSIYDFSQRENIMMLDVIKEYNQFDFLYILYMMMRGNCEIIKQMAIEMILILLKNLSIHQEYDLKNLILTRTFIFLVILSVYIKSPNDLMNILSSRFLKTFLISHVEGTNLMLNLFPMTLFYYIDKKPNPINWLDHEWDNFFTSILRDHNTTSLIWNSKCRNELLEYINSLIDMYENFTEDNAMALAFHLDNDEKEKEIPSFNLYKAFVKDEAVSGYLQFKSNTSPVTNQYEKEINVNHVTKLPINCGFYCFNYKEIKMEYQTLKKHVFVWQYYLKKIINESGRPNLAHHIEKPKKFWKKLMNELIVSYNDNKILLIVKTLTLLYKFYFEIIGVFKEYEYFINLFNSTNSIDVKIMIVQMFLVTVECEEKDIKEPNLKNLIELKAPQYFINFIPNLVTENYLIESLENSFTFEKISTTIESNKPSYSFLDNKTLFIKNLVPDDINFDKKYPNYSNYVHIDESWFTADKNIKTTTIIVRLFKLLLKRFSIIDEKLQKINFPLPKIKLICFEANNFIKIISLLFSENENLVIETLDLIINFMNDPLNYKKIAYKTNLVDILVFYMIKYKSRSIMKYLDNLNFYHNIFFDSDYLLRNESISEDEKEFLIHYPNANKFLMRYFPMNCIYHYLTTDFMEFVKILFQNNYTADLIWDQEMFEYLIKILKATFVKDEQGCSRLSLNFNPNLKINYLNLKDKSICFLYYIDLYISNKTKIEEAHVNIFSKCLNKKIKRKLENLPTNSFESYDEELMLYLVAINNLIVQHDLVLGDFTSYISEICEKIIDKNSPITENENKMLSIILNSLFISISNTPNEEPYENYLDLFKLLLKSLDYCLNKFYQEKSEKDRKETINVLKTVIDIVNKQPLLLNHLNQFKSVEKVFSLFHKILFTEIFEYYLSERNLQLSEEINELIQKIISFINELTKNPISCTYLIEKNFFLEIIYFCMNYKIHPKNELDNSMNDLAFKSLFILKKIITNILLSESLDENSNSYKAIYKEFSLCLENIFEKQLLKEISQANITSFNESAFVNNNNNYREVFLKLKDNYENPEFIWNKQLRKELKQFLLLLIKKINLQETIDCIEEGKTFKYLSFKDELRVDYIYIRIYNRDPNWTIENPDSFLKNCKDLLFSLDGAASECQNKIFLLLSCISNAIKFSQANEFILLKDEKFFEVLLDLLQLKLSGGEILSSGLNLIYTLSTKISFNKLMDLNIFFLFMNVIENCEEKDCILPILNILKSSLKVPEILEKINLSIFLFLLKKVIILKSSITKQNKDNINSLRVEILKLIKKFVFNEKVGFAIKGLYEFYLPLKIIENLFSGKEVFETHLSWIDSELELPDLIWNSDAMNQSKKLLYEDCKFILNDMKNLENFPSNLVTHKLGPHDVFFFEITDEFRIDNTYIRIYNKDPSYNIGKSLISFLKNVLESSKECMRHFTILNFMVEENEKIDKFQKTDKSIMKIHDTIRCKLLTLLSAICLILEQINFNDFNENLGVSSMEEMKKVILDEQEKDLLNLVQKSFDFSKLLSKELLLKIFHLSNYILTYSVKNILGFDSSIRLLTLQILFLISTNKQGLELLCEKFDIINLLDKMYLMQDKLGDCIIF